MATQASAIQKVGSVFIVGVLPQDENASRAIKSIGANQFIVDLRQKIVAPPKEIHQGRYLAIGYNRLAQILNLRSESDFQTSKAVDQRFQELAQYLLGTGFSPVFLVDPPAVGKIRQALESVINPPASITKSTQAQEIQKKALEIIDKKPTAAPILAKTTTTPAAGISGIIPPVTGLTAEELSKLARQKPEVFLTNLIGSDLPTVTKYRQEFSYQASQITQAVKGGQLSDKEMKLAKVFQNYGQAAETIEKIKLKSPKLDRFLKIIAKEPGPVQSRLGKIWGGLISEADVLYSAKKRGLSFSTGFIAGKAVDWTEDRIFVKTLKTHAYDEYGHRRFRPLMALNRKIYSIFHVRDESGKIHFRPTYAARKSFASSRLGKKTIPVFKKIAGQIGKFFKPFAKLGGKVLAAFTIATTIISLGWKLTKKALQWIGGAAAGLYFYFLMQGLLPVIIGATIGFFAGGTIGTIAGAIIGAKLGFTIGASIGFAVGGPFGAAIGGAVGAAVGLVAGAVIGGSVGALLGTAIGGTVGYIAAGHLGGAATLTGAGVGATVGTFLPIPGGTIVGAVVGGAAGYAIGEYVIPWFQKTAIPWIEGAPGTIGGLFGGFFGGIAERIADFGQTIWGGITKAASFAAGAANQVTGFLSTVSVSPTVSSLPIGGLTIGAPAAVVFIGVTTGAAFFNPFSSLGVPQRSQLIDVVKTANPNRIDNESDLPKTINFQIQITAKSALSNVGCQDKTNLIKGDGSVETIAEPSVPCPSSMTAGQSFSNNLSVDAKEFNTIMVNRITVTAKADPEGDQVAQADAVVVIGSPSNVDTPTGWPTSGVITTLPNSGSGGHGEGIDIASPDGLPGTPICATFSGTAYSFKDGDPGIYGTTGLGNYVVITSTAANGTISAFFGHLQSAEFDGGPFNITKGQKIGTMDSTGHSTGNHLHYEFWGIPMDFPYIPVAKQNLSLGMSVIGCQ